MNLLDSQVRGIGRQEKVEKQIVYEGRRRETKERSDETRIVRRMSEAARPINK